jgi:hypothetical protein
MKNKYDKSIATMLGYLQGTNAVALVELGLIRENLVSDDWTREDILEKVTHLEQRLTEAQSHAEDTLKQSYEETMTQLQLSK